MFVGETTTRDKAVDEEVELVFGEAGNVTFETETGENDKADRWQHSVTIRNANPFPVAFEFDFPLSGSRIYSQLPGKVTSKPGKRVSRIMIPANDGVRVSYRSREPEEKDDEDE